MLSDNNDTIAAVATAVGESGIGIVRLSGKEALNIADKAFLPKKGGPPSTFKTHTLRYGWIADENKKVIDEVMLTVMRSPGSYTREDIVEINCHGGILAMREVLDLALRLGCRLAEPGEFTKRAFINGRIDLAQAEAVLDVIRAKTDSALKVGVEQLKGGLSKNINKTRQRLLGILSGLEASIDFPDEEAGQRGNGSFMPELAKADKELREMLYRARQGQLLREGIHTVICGRPNAGKSSLLNSLLKKERSIVTPVAGTTRDTIEEIIDIKGIPVRIVDTAGILEPRDLIEKKAMQRSGRHIKEADLAILLFDGSKRIGKQDEFIMQRLRKKNKIAVINKIDLKQKIEKQRLLKEFSSVIEISAKKARNINLLEDAIADFVYRGDVSPSHPVIVSNLRHISILRQAQKIIAETVNSVDNGLSDEFIAQGVKDALASLDEILGKRFSEDLLDKIFSDFCIGK